MERDKQMIRRAAKTQQTLSLLHEAWNTLVPISHQYQLKGPTKKYKYFLLNLLVGTVYILLKQLFE